MAKYKCIAYCRVSKHTSRTIKDDNGNDVRPSKEPSIEEQVSAIKSFVELHSDEFELVAEPFTEVKSGSSSRNRTQFKEVQRWLLDGINGCNTLLVYMKDRIARNAKDYMNSLWVIKGNDNYIFSIEGNPASKPICVTHNVDEKGNDGLLNILMDAFDAYAYESYLEGLSKRSVARNERRIFEKNEKYLSGFAHYGYKLVESNGEKHYEIAEKEAEIVKKMFELYIYNDWGYDRIADWLNEQGYKYRKNSNKQEYYCSFTSDAVRRNIQFDGFATGNAKFFQTENILRRKPIANKVHEKFDKKYPRIADIPEDELNEFLDTICETERDYVVENVYPIIIDKDTYSQYLKVKSNRGNAIKTSLQPNDSGWLAGIGYCACGAKLYACGSRICHHKKKQADGSIKDQTYMNVYKCSRNALSKKSHRDPVEPCKFGKKGYSYHIDEVILHFLKKILTEDSRFYTFYATEMHKNMINNNGNIITLDSRIENLKKDYGNVRKKLSVLNMDYVDGAYANEVGSGLPTEDDYKLEKQKLVDEMKKISNSITELSYQKTSKGTDVDIDKLKKRIKNSLENNPPELFKIMLDKVVVLHDENGYQLRLFMHHYPDKFNPIILEWDGRRSNPDTYIPKLNPALYEAIGADKKSGE